MPQLGPPRKSLLSTFRGRSAGKSPSKRQSLGPQCEEDVDRPPESSCSSEDEEGAGHSNGSDLVEIEIETPQTKVKGKTCKVIKTRSTPGRTTRGGIERPVALDGSTGSSPRSGAPSSGTKRKRETSGPSISQPARPPSPTKEEEALFSQPRSQFSMYGSQRASQGYLSQANSGHGQRRQAGKDLRPEAAALEGSRKPKFKAPPGQDAVPSSSPAAPIFKRSAIALAELPSNNPPSLNITAFRRTVSSPKRSAPMTKPEFKRQSPHPSSPSEPPSPDAHRLNVPSETYEQQLQALGTAPEHIDFISSNPNEVSCPICGTAVSKPLYDSFTAGRQLGYSRAMDFCAAHKAQTAELRLAKASYPPIDWANFDKRLDRFHDNLESLLTGRTPSTYRRDLEAKVATGTSRAAMRNPDAADAAALTGSVGYYGGRGASRMTEHILRRFGRRIREVAQTDGLFAEVGVPGFVRGVLVPELAVLLVMEDAGGCGGGRAREILEESAEVGELWDGEADAGGWGEIGGVGETRDSGEDVVCAERDERDLSPASSELSVLSDGGWAILDDTPARTQAGSALARTARTTRSGLRPEVILLHDD